MNNIKCDISVNGMISADMPIETLKAMRDGIDKAIRKYRKDEIDRYITDIQAAIDAARDAGYEVWVNRRLYENADDIELYKVGEDENDDWDEEDEDENEGEDDDYCYGCRDDCLHCPHC